MQVNWLKKKRQLDAKKKEKLRLRNAKRRKLNPVPPTAPSDTNPEKKSNCKSVIDHSDSTNSSNPRMTFVEKYTKMLEEQKRKMIEEQNRSKEEIDRKEEDPEEKPEAAPDEVEVKQKEQNAEEDTYGINLDDYHYAPSESQMVPKQPMLKPLDDNVNGEKSESNENTLDIGEADKFKAINLKPPPITPNADNEDAKDDGERIAFWNNVRLRLRSRLPFETLQNLIDPQQWRSQTDTQNARHREQRSPKLWTVDRRVKWTDTVAIDCEMVGVKAGVKKNKDALARVSIVNFDGQCMYDEFVSCQNVNDYRTWVSGVEREDLEKYGKPYDVVHKEVLRILKGRRIVGHSLDNDLKVLRCTDELDKKWRQLSRKELAVLKKKAKTSKESLRALKTKAVNNKGKWYFDTAKCELLHDNLQRPRGLKYCLELFLGVHIQSEEHDSVIDALSTMMLYRAILPEIAALKIQQKKKWLKMKKKGDKEGMKQMEEIRANTLLKKEKRKRTEKKTGKSWREMQIERKMKKQEERFKKKNPYRSKLDQLIAAGKEKDMNAVMDKGTCLLCGQWGHTADLCKKNVSEFAKYSDVDFR